ncbi:hypothetical protein KKC1_19250, partial [Calderihabitans maritimus]
MRGYPLQAGVIGVFRKQVFNSTRRKRP